MGKALRDLLNEHNFQDNNLNPRNVKSDMLSPKPNDKFSNDVKQLKNLVENIPTIYGTDSVRILTQGKVDTKKLKQKSLKVAGNLIEKGLGKLGGIGKSAGSFLNNKLNETIKPQLPSDLIEGTSTTKGLYTDMLTGGVENKKTAVGNFLSSFATPTQYIQNIGPAATSVIADYASKKVGGVANQLGIGKQGAEEPTLLGGIVGGVKREQTMYPSMYVDGLVNGQKVNYKFDKSNGYTNPQNGVNFNQSQFARKPNIGQIYDGTLYGVTENNPGVPKHLRGNLVENINPQSIIYNANSSRRYNAKLNIFVTDSGKRLYDTNLIYTFTKKDDYLVNATNLATTQDLDNLAIKRNNVDGVPTLGFNSPKANSVLQSKSEGLNTYRTDKVELGGVYYDREGFLNVTNSPIGNTRAGEYKIIDVINVNKPKRFSDMAYDEDNDVNTGLFGGYDNRTGDNLVGKINKEHRNLSKDALNDKGYDLIEVSFTLIEGKSGVEIKLMSTLTGLTDTPTPNWSEAKGIGSPYKFYFYESFEREISFKVQLYATNELELGELWKKVNALMQLTKPSGFGTNRGIFGKLLKLKIGNLINEESGFLTNCTMTVPDNSPWEIQKKSQSPFMCEMDFTYKVLNVGRKENFYDGITPPGYLYSTLEKEGRIPLPPLQLPPRPSMPTIDMVQLPKTALNKFEFTPKGAGEMSPYQTFVEADNDLYDTQKAEEYLNSTRTDLPTLEANADIQQTNAAADYLKQTSTPALGTANAAESNSFTVNKAITPSSNDSPVQTPKWGKQKEYDPKTGDWKKNIFGKDKLFKVRAVDNAQN
jgi:hypothetical protein